MTNQNHFAFQPAHLAPQFVVILLSLHQVLQGHPQVLLTAMDTAEPSQRTLMEYIDGKAGVAPDLGIGIIPHPSVHVLHHLPSNCHQ